MARTDRGLLWQQLADTAKQPRQFGRYAPYIECIIDLPVHFPSAFNTSSQPAKRLNRVNRYLTNLASHLQSNLPGSVSSKYTIDRYAATAKPSSTIIKPLKSKLESPEDFFYALLQGALHYLQLNGSQPPLPQHKTSQDTKPAFNSTLTGLQRCIQLCQSYTQPIHPTDSLHTTGETTMPTTPTNTDKAETQELGDFLADGPLSDVGSDTDSLVDSASTNSQSLSATSSSTPASPKPEPTTADADDNAATTATATSPKPAPTTGNLLSEMVKTAKAQQALAMWQQVHAYMIKRELVARGGPDGTKDPQQDGDFVKRDTSFKALQTAFRTGGLDQTAQVALFEQQGWNSKKWTDVIDEKASKLVTFGLCQNGLGYNLGQLKKEFAMLMKNFVDALKADPKAEPEKTLSAENVAEGFTLFDTALTAQIEAERATELAAKKAADPEERTAGMMSGMTSS